MRLLFGISVLWLIVNARNECKSKNTEYRCTKVTDTKSQPSEYYVWACCNSNSLNVHCGSFEHGGYMKGMQRYLNIYDLNYALEEVTVEKGTKRYNNWSNCKGQQLCIMPPSDEYKHLNVEVAIPCDPTRWASNKKKGGSNQATFAEIWRKPKNIGFKTSGKQQAKGDSKGQQQQHELTVTVTPSKTAGQHELQSDPRHILQRQQTETPSGRSQLVIPHHAREEYYDYIARDGYDDEQQEQSVQILVYVAMIGMISICCLTCMCLGGLFGFLAGHFLNANKKVTHIQADNVEI